MLSSSGEVLEAAVAGIPEIARRIAFLPTEDHASAFDAAEQIYLQTAKDLGGAEDLVLNWTSAVMFRLREEVEEQLLINRKLLKALHEELIRNPVETTFSESEFGPSDDASPKDVEKSWPAADAETTPSLLPSRRQGVASYRLRRSSG